MDTIIWSLDWGDEPIDLDNGMGSVEIVENHHWFGHEFVILLIF